jgi:hypothetical protein
LHACKFSGSFEVMGLLHLEALPAGFESRLNH